MKRGEKMEKAFGKDNVYVGAIIPVKEDVGHRTNWVIEKFKGDFKSREEAIKANAELIEKLEFEGNCLLNSGINLMWTLLGGGSGTKWDNADAALGVGDSDTAESASQTDLQGTNKTYKAMDSGYPTYGTSQQIVFRSTFGSADANYHWQEIVCRNGVSSGTCMNRKVQDMGTKASGTTWVATLTITLS
jgi:hypothetical protein